MTEEEKKARKSEYMKEYYRNMSDFQREKRRLKNLENKKRIYHENKTSCKNENYDKYKSYRLRNAEKIMAYQAEYRKKQKEKKQESC
jgi:fibrillarin-like rRNA methylase